MIQEHDRVVLTADIPADGLKAGDVGTVVHIYTQSDAVEVEFVTLDGATVAVATLQTAQIRPVAKGEITHARQLVTA